MDTIKPICSTNNNLVKGNLRGGCGFKALLAAYSERINGNILFDVDRALVDDLKNELRDTIHLSKANNIWLLWNNVRVQMNEIPCLDVSFTCLRDFAMFAILFSCRVVIIWNPIGNNTEPELRHSFEPTISANNVEIMIYMCDPLTQDGVPLFYPVYYIEGKTKTEKE